MSADAQQIFPTQMLAEHADRRSEFDAVAERRYAQIIECGEAIPWNEMRIYLEDRAAGRPSRCPDARALSARPIGKS